jgi:biopolymer transport protein ExbB/TolQ
LTTAAALIVAVTCVVIAAIRQAERDGRETASPDVLHDYSRQSLPEDDGLRKLGDEW